MKNTIREYLLNNMETIRNIVSELNNLNGSLKMLDTMNKEQLNNFMDKLEAEGREDEITYGYFDPEENYFKFNEGGNLVSLNDWELEEEYIAHIDEIVDALLDNMNNIDIVDNELRDMLEQPMEAEAVIAERCSKKIAQELFYTLNRETDNKEWNYYVVLNDGWYIDSFISPDNKQAEKVFYKEYVNKKGRCRRR